MFVIPMVFTSSTPVRPFLVWYPIIQSGSKSFIAYLFIFLQVFCYSCKDAIEDRNEKCNQLSVRVFVRVRCCCICALLTKLTYRNPSLLPSSPCRFSDAQNKNKKEDDTRKTQNIAFLMLSLFLCALWFAPFLRCLWCRSWRHTYSHFDFRFVIHFLFLLL